MDKYTEAIIVLGFIILDELTAQEREISMLKEKLLYFESLVKKQ